MLSVFVTAETAIETRWPHGMSVTALCLSCALTLLCQDWEEVFPAGLSLWRAMVVEEMNTLQDSFRTPSLGKKMPSQQFHLAVFDALSSNPAKCVPSNSGITPQAMAIIWLAWTQHNPVHVLKRARLHASEILKAAEDGKESKENDSTASAPSRGPVFVFPCVHWNRVCLGAAGRAGRRGAEAAH